jgi:putative copper resistance protein D
LDAALILIRVVHFASSITVSGILLFRLVVAAPALRVAGEEVPRSDALHRLLARILWISLAVAVASGAAWLLALSVEIAGGGWTGVIADDVAWTILTQTRFGHAWMARLIVATAIAIGMIAIDRRTTAVARWWRELSAALAAVLVGTLAYSGHAGATPGMPGEIHLAADILHLVAASAWLGGLLPLALLLSAAERSGAPAWDEVVVAAAYRFSSLGRTSVAILIATGLVNSWYLVGSLPALTATTYGRLLLLKVAVFATMLGIAGINLLRLTPRLPEAASIRQLRRNALIETALGLVVVVLVGMLGTVPPALHMMSGHVH